MKTNFIFKMALAVILLLCSIGSSLYWGSKGLQRYILRNSPTENQAPAVELSYDQIGDIPFSATDNTKQIPTPTNRYTIEISVAKNLQDAETSIESFSREGLPAFFSPEQIESGAVIYRIRMGLFATQEEAIAGLATLAQRTGHKGKLITL